jgi:ABC-type uncharacterized transport system auxiliary subunit
MKKLAYLLCIACALWLAACAAPDDAADTIPLGSHRVTVRPDCVSKQISNRFPGKEAIYNLTCGRTQVTIKNEELLVNGKSYGMLREGDAVRVEGEEVFVNGSRVQEVASQ